MSNEKAMTKPLAIWLVLALSLMVVGCSKTSDSPQAPAAAAAIEKITTPTGIEMVRLPAGEFVMGDDAGEPEERPAHTVRVSGFYIDTGEVTQKDYEALVGRNPSKFKGPDRPVDSVSWFAAVQYCNARSAKEGLKPSYDLRALACDFSADGYRLPTQAEWEYACRAGTRSRYSFGDDAAELAAYGWFKENSAKATHPGRGKAPNPWGLYDMCGNVMEWCNDFYAAGYGAAESVAVDPRGPAEGTKRVIRGGSWASDAASCRSSARAAEAPGLADACFGIEVYGFRCVRRAPAITEPRP
jgi:formylglycine-generating enzyme required for sulfatase activity